jgi:endonuclease YncB( thermonuclease family)
MRCTAIKPQPTGTLAASSARRRIKKTLSNATLVLCLWGAYGAHAATLAGEVVALADGDTVTVLDPSRQQHKVRLAGIDAPEKRQPFGERSKQALATLTFRKQVVVEWHKRDRYGRIVGFVKVGGTDAGLELVRMGLAWHYKAFEREQSAVDRGRYADAEAGARAAHIGLWRDPNPTPPWEFRHRR